LAVLLLNDAHAVGAHHAPVLAYLDPGSGSLILQVVIASVLSGLMYFRNARAKLLEKLRTLFRRGARRD
jgi:hypothetical protein